MRWGGVFHVIVYLVSWRHVFWLLSLPVMNIVTKKNMGGGGYLSLQFTVHHWGKPGQELKAGREVETVEDHRLLDYFQACAQWLSLIALAHLPGGDGTHDELCIIQQLKRNPSKRYTQAKMMEEILQLTLLPGCVNNWSHAYSPLVNFDAQLSHFETWPFLSFSSSRYNVNRKAQDRVEV